MTKITDKKANDHLGEYAADVDFDVTGGQLDHCMGPVMQSLGIPGLRSPFTYIASYLTLFNIHVEDMNLHSMSVLF